VPRRSPDGAVPKRATLYEIAAAQAGYFSLEQAAEAGHSRQLLQYRLRSGEIERSLRGVYRLVQFPSTDREDLVPVWLWTNRQGVFGPSPLARNDPGVLAKNDPPLLMG